MASMEIAESVLEPVRTDLLNLLVVEDERSIREACREVSESLGFNTVAVEDALRAYRVLESRSIDVVVLDLKLPGAGGQEMLREIKRRRPEAEIIVVTGLATVQAAVQAMKNGAYDYVTKPFNIEELRLLLDRVARHARLSSENRLRREKVKSKHGFGPLIGGSPEMEKIYRIIAKAASASHPVLIVGESGTGKELVARCIHASGPNRDRPFLPVDCGSIVPTLIESELFGHVRGAFTGAVKPKDGLLAMAEGGTVLLDEIAELPVDMQTKLLRAIQEKEIRPVGSTRHVPIDVRILAATNRELEPLVAQGAFRKDLYYRLNVLTLRVPPLRQRTQDIPLLVGHFMEKLSRESGVERRLSDDALKVLMDYDWPGNVRELENSLERASTMSSGPLIHTADLPTALQNWRQPAAAVAASGQIVPMAELEKQAILNTLVQTKGDKLLAARLLGIGKTTLYRKLKEYAAKV